MRATSRLIACGGTLGRFVTVKVRAEGAPTRPLPLWERVGVRERSGARRPFIVRGGSTRSMIVSRYLCLGVGGNCFSDLPQALAPTAVSRKAEAGILVSQIHLPVLESKDAPVTEGDAIAVAAQIIHHRLGVGDTGLGVDYPFAGHERIEHGSDLSGIFEPHQAAIGEGTQGAPHRARKGTG
jgi:hypothetical protein